MVVDDGIGHVVGLSPHVFDDVGADPEDLVTWFGPIGMFTFLSFCRMLAAHISIDIFSPPFSSIQQIL